jgi:8-oxo-dGTP pyrophosphatase MutT (NUDIX family)
MGLAARKQLAGLDTPLPQMAALPWRLGRDGGIEVLMVTSRVSGHWLIPKGWPMPGKTDPEAARIEALEEAGITGKISPIALGSYRYDKLRKDGTSIECTVTVYPLAVNEERKNWRERASRQRRWFPLEEAAAKAYEPGLRALLGMLDPAMVLSATSPA